MTSPTRSPAASDGDPAATLATSFAEDRRSPSFAPRGTGILIMRAGVMPPRTAPVVAIDSGEN
tara:strand:+ start:387 stop:575 length:189 start_codon:yes stop_codon:yes gene_type:complete